MADPGHPHTIPPRASATSATSAKGSQRRPASRIQEEHARIARHLKDLEQRLGALRGPCRPGDLRNDVAGRVARLQSELAEHFAEEERLGFVPRAVVLEPRLARRARRILAEHDLLRLELSQLSGTLARGTTSWDRVREDFGAFATSLGEHEHREGELIRDAYLDDLGGGA